MFFLSLPLIYSSTLKDGHGDNGVLQYLKKREFFAAVARIGARFTAHLIAPGAFAMAHLHEVDPMLTAESEAVAEEKYLLVLITKDTLLKDTHKRPNTAADVLLHTVCTGTQDKKRGGGGGGGGGSVGDHSGGGDQGKAMNDDKAFERMLQKLQHWIMTSNVLTVFWEINKKRDGLIDSTEMIRTCHNKLGLNLPDMQVKRLMHRFGDAFDISSDLIVKPGGGGKPATVHRATRKEVLVSYKSFQAVVKQFKHYSWYFDREAHQVATPPNGGGNKEPPKHLPQSYYNPTPRLYDGQTLNRSNKAYSFRGTPDARNSPVCFLKEEWT